MGRVGLLGSGALLLGVAGCVDESFRIGDGYELPATLEQVLPQAQAVATAWDDDAYLWGMGGEFTVVDSTARGYDHSFRFYSRRLERRLDLHLFSGTPWARDAAKWPPPTPVSVNPPAIGSGEAVRRVVETARDLQVPVPETLTARYLAFPVWPEGAPDDSQVVAWRVDFLDLRTSGPPGDQDLVWWSVLRAYVDPATADLLQVILREEVYPPFDSPPPP